MKISLEFDYNQITEIERIADVCSSISCGFFQEKRFYLSQKLIKGDPRFIYLPRFEYEKISSFWKEMKELYKVDYLRDRCNAPIFSKMSVLNIPVANPDEIKKFEEKLVNQLPKLETELSKVFGDNLAKDIHVIVRPTLYGSSGSFTEVEEKEDGLLLNFTYIRLDFDFSVLVEMIVSSIVLHTRHIEWGGPFWFENESIVDYLLTSTSLSSCTKGFIKTTDSLSDAEVVNDLEVAQSAKYYQELGFPIKSVLTKRDDRLLVNKKSIKNLTQQEIKALTYFMNNRNRVVRYDELGSFLNEEYSLWAISKLISRIREKIRESVKGRELIHTIRNVGYILYD